MAASSSDDDIGSFFGAASIGSPLKRNLWSADDFSLGRAMVHHYQCQTLPRLEAPTHHEPRHIPQIIHFVWLGNKPLPLSSNGSEEENDCIASWRRHHPKGTIRVWGDDDIAPPAVWYNQAALQYAVHNRNYGMASDILRLELLWEYGGTYVDLDYLCVDSVNDLMRRFDFFCGASNTGAVELNNGLMGCHPHSPLVRKLMEAVHTWFEDFSKHSQPYNVMATFLDPNSQSALHQVMALTPDDVIRNTGPGLLTRALAQALTEDADAMVRVAIVPYSVFHPLPNTFQRVASVTDDVVQSHIVQGQTKAVHLWQCSWQDP